MPVKSRLSKVEDVSSLQKPIQKIPFIKNLKMKSYTPILVILLMIGSFFIGMLVDKVQYLQSGGGYQGTGQQAAGNPAGQPPAKKFDRNTGAYPVIGSNNAKVTVVEFADFQCPFCQKLFSDVYPSLKKDYIDKIGRAHV